MKKLNLELHRLNPISGVPELMYIANAINEPHYLYVLDLLRDLWPDYRYFEVDSEVYQLRRMELPTLANDTDITLDLDQVEIAVVNQLDELDRVLIMDGIYMIIDRKFNNR